MFLYRTKLGIKIIDYLGKRYKKALKVLSYLSVILGYILMVTMIYFLVNLIYIFTKPELVKLIKVPPLMPLIPYLPALFRIDWLPPFYFTYWIIAVAIVAIAHEGFHGVYARLHKVKIKSTGFGFLGPFLAFFVEQDEKEMKKKKIFPQLSILSAGVFANIIVGIIFYFLMVLLFFSSYSPSGAVFNDYSFSVAAFSVLNNATIGTERIEIDGINLTQVIIEEKSYFVWDGFLKKDVKIENDSLIKLYQDLSAIHAGILGDGFVVKNAITKINGEEMRNHEDVRKELANYLPGEKIKIEVRSNGEIKEYEIELGESYEENRSVIGVGFVPVEQQGLRGFLYNLIEMNFIKDSSADYAPKYNPELITFIWNLLWWIVLINLSVALVNMLPIGIFDGGRFFYLTILAITKKENFARKSFKFATALILFILLILMFLWFIGMI